MFLSYSQAQRSQYPCRHRLVVSELGRSRQNGGRGRVGVHHSQLYPRAEVQPTTGGVPSHRTLRQTWTAEEVHAHGILYPTDRPNVSSNKIIIHSFIQVKSLSSMRDQNPAIPVVFPMILMLATSQQRTITPQDTWSCPNLDLNLFECWYHSLLNLSYLRVFWVSNIHHSFYFALIPSREKGRDLTQSYDKSPYTNRNVKRAKWQHKQRHKKVRLNSGCGPT